MKLVVFDLETDGLRDDCQIIQIAAIAMNGPNELATFERKLQFDESVAEASALEVNSYEPDTWRRTAIPEEVALRNFADFCRTYADVQKVSKGGKPYRVARLCGHNVARFDCDRLWRRMHSREIFFPADGTPLDTYQLAAWFYHLNPPSPRKLDLASLCDALGAPAPSHDALDDVRATARLATLLMERIQGVGQEVMRL